MRIENQWPDGTAFSGHSIKRPATTIPAASASCRSLAAKSASASSSRASPCRTWSPKSWPERGLAAGRAIPDSPLFGSDGAVLRTVLDRAWKSGLAHIFLLECGGKIAAASINFVYAGRMEAYLTSYDEAFERASPGTILIVEYAQWSFDRGLTLVDFLRGEEAFKFRMANAETALSTFTGRAHPAGSRRRVRSPLAGPPPQAAGRGRDHSRSRTGSGWLSVRRSQPGPINPAIRPRQLRHSPRPAPGGAAAQKLRQPPGREPGAIGKAQHRPEAVRRRRADNKQPRHGRLEMARQHRRLIGQRELARDSVADKAQRAAWCPALPVAAITWSASTVVAVPSGIRNVTAARSPRMAEPEMRAPSMTFTFRSTSSRRSSPVPAPDACGRPDA